MRELACAAARRVLRVWASRAQEHVNFRIWRFERVRELRRRVTIPLTPTTTKAQVLCLRLGCCGCEESCGFGASRAESRIVHCMSRAASLQPRTVARSRRSTRSPSKRWLSRPGRSSGSRVMRSTPMSAPPSPTTPPNPFPQNIRPSRVCPGTSSATASCPASSRTT